MSQAPQYLQRYQSRDLGTTLSQNLGANAPPYVSIAGGRFTLIDAAGNEQPCAGHDPQLGVYVDACIIDVNDHISRVFYLKEYDPSAQTFSPPDCWSDNGVGPSVSCSGPQAKSCTPDPDGVYGCKWAVWGSATSAQGKQIPACQQVQKVALLIPQVPQGVFLLRVPPNSHKNLRSYNELSKRSGIDISNVITRIYFDRTTQGTLLFSGVTWIDEGIAQAREAAYAEKKTDAIVGRNDVARPVLAAPQQVQQIAPPAQQPTQQVQQPQSFLPGSPQNQQSNTFAATGQAAPFVPPTQAAAAPAATTSAAASPSNGAPQRRRRRTSAEVQAANAAPPTGQPAASPQAPFPHAGQATQPVQTDMAFGMTQGQPASGNADVTQALDSFFQN